MRRIVIAAALIAAQLARADPVAFPEIDPGPLCETLAQVLFGGAGSVVDPEMLKDNARKGCLMAQAASRNQTLALWDTASDALRKKCQARIGSYAELGLCLLQEH
jgi:hypothetical protein